jgi:hypothetical protein
MTAHRRSSLRVATATLAASALACAAWTATSPAHAATTTGPNVLVFSDPTYVDVGTLADVSGGDFDHEGINIQLALKAGGASVSTVTTAGPAALAAALKGKDTFVIPETEEDSLGEAISAASIKVIQDFARAGGTVVVSDDYSGNLNAIFGWSLDFPDSSPDDGTWGISAAPGKAFAGGPASLQDNNGSDWFATATLPAGAVPVYADAETGSTLVFTKSYGRGTIVELGWDWYDAKPADAAGQDGGWNDVLRRAVRIAPPVVLQAPGAVSGLHVSGKPAAARRTVRWSAPKATGGTAVTGYQVVVQQGRKVLLSRTVGARTVSLVVKRKLIKHGKRASVKVRAVNKVGAGAWSSTTFTIKR